MVARLGNVLYWAFSSLAVFLLFIPAWLLQNQSYGQYDISFLWMFFGSLALLSWFFGRACHYVLGGDALALWERALIAPARRCLTGSRLGDTPQSPGVRVFGIVALIGAVGLVLLTSYANHGSAQLGQQDNQPFEVGQRKAAIPTTDLLVSDVILRNGDTQISAAQLTGVFLRSNVRLGGTIANGSGRTLRRVSFEVTVKDCPPGHSTASGPWQRSETTASYGASPADPCRIVGQESTAAEVDIPPDQTRAFESSTMDFKGVPPVDPKRLRVASWRILSANE